MLYQYEVPRPVGLTEACQAVEAVCANARLYRMGCKKPANLILPLDPGNGRTTLTEFVTDMYKTHNILGFTSGLDDYVEVTVDGSSTDKIARSFASFQAAAIYENEYRNVAAVDISDVAKYLTGPQLPAFLREAEKLCQTACVLFFVSGDPTPNEEKLVDKLVSHIGQRNIRYIPLSPYTCQDICELTIRSLGDRGISLEEEDSFREGLTALVEKLGLSTARDALDLAEDMLPYAEFLPFSAILTQDALGEVGNERSNTYEQI